MYRVKSSPGGPLPAMVFMCFCVLVCFQALSLSAFGQTGKVTGTGQASVPGVAGRIVFNQIGFFSKQPKLAVVTGKLSSPSFYLIDTRTGQRVFSGLLSAYIKSSNSQTLTRLADFSPWSRPGTYCLYVTGLPVSAAFKIGPNVLAPVLAAALKGFYFQRASFALTPAYAGKWARAAGHPDSSVYIHASAASGSRPEGSRISSPGGWYDAGDYNKYIVNSGISTSTLLSAWEDYPVAFKSLKVNIPESAGQLPDILSEALVNMRWMMTMQDPADGGLYHKLTNTVFDPMVMPAKAIARRYVVQKSTAASLDFAAVMAQGARIFKKFEHERPGLSDSMLRAAEKAWTWAKANPHNIYDQKAMNLDFKPEVITGEYGDRYLEDEWFWAATELLASTGQASYYDEVLKGQNNRLPVQEWAGVQMLGYYALNHPGLNLPAFATALAARLQSRLDHYADSLIEASSRLAFHMVMGQSKSDFIWGSNAVAANQGILLMSAYRHTGNKKFLHAAGSNMDYLLGRNATGYCFVTGFGYHSPLHPHHRPSIADGIVEPVPGLLVAGPNPGRQDKQFYPFIEPETAYVDDDKAYACNEIAINWNGPLVYLSGALESTFNQSH